jgi:hypothetical protein
VTPQSPPPLLQIYREPLQPGSEAAYRENEGETARLCAELKCPHAYLGIESLTGPKEVWYFNGYQTEEEKKQVADDYARNAPLMAALERSGRRKASLTGTHADVLARHRADLSRGVPWVLGRGRFLVITMMKGDPEVRGSVFEAEDGTRFVFLPARTQGEAEAAAAAAGPETRVFAVRPEWSHPSEGWMAADPDFWEGARR